MRVNPVDFLEKQGDIREKRRKFELNLKKQTQFIKGQNERKWLYERVLWGFLWFWAAKKQTQFKANFIVLRKESQGLRTACGFPPSLHRKVSCGE